MSSYLTGYLTLMNENIFIAFGTAFYIRLLLFVVVSFDNLWEWCWLHPTRLCQVLSQGVLLHAHSVAFLDQQYNCVLGY